MKTCTFCRSLILFGGKTDPTGHYCNDNCRQRGTIVAMSKTIPDSTVQEHLWAVHQGHCPRCNGKGPIDVHMIHRVWSALVLTSWSNNQQVSCRACGVKSQLVGILGCALLGWWGIPWGLLMTPLQIARNVIAIAKPPEAARPSQRLETIVRMGLAHDAIAEKAKAGAQAA